MLYKFIGRNGSMGFIRGLTYDLELYIDEDTKYIIACSRMKKVPYQSMKLFEDNWERVDDKLCLHCGRRPGHYCEDCYQKLLTENMRQQITINNLKDTTPGKHFKDELNLDPDIYNHIPRID